MVIFLALTSLNTTSPADRLNNLAKNREKKKKIVQAQVRTYALANGGVEMATVRIAIWRSGSVRSELQTGLF
jgi:hypothetical protein